MTPNCTKFIWDTLYNYYLSIQVTELTCVRCDYNILANTVMEVLFSHIAKLYIRLKGQIQEILIINKHVQFTKVPLISLSDQE